MADDGKYAALNGTDVDDTGGLGGLPGPPVPLARGGVFRQSCTGR
ncbi:hypothetical protein [Streptomyces fagopyri]